MASNTAAVPAKPDIDPLGDIIATLESEHGYIDSLLKTLSEQAEKLRPGKVPDYHLLLEMVDYLTLYPDQYHHPREDLLFKSLVKRDKEFKPEVDRLLHEHETIDYFSRKLFEELTDIVNGRAANRPELLVHIERYVEGYNRHLEFESNEVFPRARGTLSKAEIRELTKKTRYIDDPLFGNNVQQQYRRLSRKLHTNLEVVTDDIVVRELHAIETGIEKLSSAVDTFGQLKESTADMARNSMREQLDTVKEHSRFREEPNVLKLPVALFRIHRRHWQEGLEKIRQILNHGKDESQ